jgi:hypothetical protein
VDLILFSKWLFWFFVFEKQHLCIILALFLDSLVAVFLSSFTDLQAILNW